ncbi:serine/threonine protein phosphatase [Stakelama sp. CBK3Z-3]|uniref:Serine/threonine protein phosphatase n=1 Tax=Stakelama flava TaxID=2860338 RepID=A0ABS6XI98_9SPHN|nr:metallophosphoesterase family protein [Stakelama flava]MBW4329917.1 serine/threonine protein phosphatase [Stakelama flava]
MIFGSKGRTGHQPRTARGERVYAIGDVHGCFHELRRLLELIRTHHESRPPADRLRLIVLGDLIDRGPDSARVVRFLKNLSEATGSLSVLMGNHEEMMLASLAGDRAAMRLWTTHGGRETLASFGFDPARLDNGEEMRALAGAMREAVSQPVIDWLRARPLWERSGDYLFVHAGVRPGVALDRQQRHDLLWIRDDFLNWEGALGGATVVHGHSIETEPQAGRWRIGIDTGAYRTGRLTALFVEDGEREFLTVE